MGALDMNHNTQDSGEDDQIDSYQSLQGKVQARHLPS